MADLVDLAPKADMASMEHPLFVLRSGDKRIRIYERNGNTVTLLPGATGCATIHDKDLWIYCISQLVEASNRGEAISQTVRFTAYDFLVASNRPTSGVGYARMKSMLRRLAGTRVETNIKTNDQRSSHGFGLIDSWNIIESASGSSYMVAVEVKLPDWLFRSIEAMDVLTLSRDYFRLRKPLDRRIYELARKHCGSQPSWRVSLKILHGKSGSTSPLRNFRRDICTLANSGHLPDYLMAYDPTRDLLTFYAVGPKGKISEAKDMLADRPHASLNAHEQAHARKCRKPRTR